MKINQTTALGAVAILVAFATGMAAGIGLTMATLLTLLMVLIITISGAIIALLCLREAQDALIRKIELEAEERELAREEEERRFDRQLARYVGEVEEEEYILPHLRNWDTI